MNVRTLPRTAVEGYLRLVRVPLDGAISLLPGNGTGTKPAAELALDRLDARLRSVIGTLLSDPALRQDAERRRHAVLERERALGLRAEAEARSEEADSRLQERQQQATRQQEQATRRAEARRQHATRER